MLGLSKIHYVWLCELMLTATTEQKHTHAHTNRVQSLSPFYLMK